MSCQSRASNGKTSAHEERAVINHVIAVVSDLPLLLR